MHIGQYYIPGRLFRVLNYTSGPVTVELGGTKRRTGAVEYVPRAIYSRHIVHVYTVAARLQCAPSPRQRGNREARGDDQGWGGTLGVWYSGELRQQYSINSAATSSFGVFMSAPTAWRNSRDVTWCDLAAL